jgi:PAS domain S-box-containing protein
MKTNQLKAILTPTEFFPLQLRNGKILEDQQFLLASIINSSSDAIISQTPEGIITTWNPGAKKLFGYSATEAIGKNISMLIPLYCGAEEAEIIEKVRNGNHIEQYETQRLRKDGSLVYVSITISAIKNAEENITGVCKIVRDITEKVEANHKLHLSEERYWDERMLLRTLIDNLPLNVYAKDIHSRKTLANRADYEFMGAANEKEVLGKDDSEFFPAEFTRKTRMEELQIFNTGQAIINEEEQHKLRDGRKKWFLKSKIPLRNEDNQITGLVGISYDITERKKNEIAVAELNEQLNKRAVELMASNAELERFAYVASHDLQEPLRMVSSFLQLLQKKYKEQLDNTANQYIEFAVDGAERMKKLILDLLEYSRISTNKDVLADTNIGEVISQVLETFNNKITETGAIIKTQPMSVIKANKTQITQLFQNLVSNALKYNISPVPEIEIGCEDKGDHWQFFIKDNGIGIEQKFLDKVFIIFQRLHNKNQFSGTGIGLAICKKIVERHGGTIWIESQQAAGSIFFFTLKK